MRTIRRIYIKTLCQHIEVSQDGKFELPDREYTTQELKKIAREINRELRNLNNDFDYIL